MPGIITPLGKVLWYRMVKDAEARGIPIFREWVESYEKFSEFLGTPPSGAFKVSSVCERIGYFPGYLVWSTKHEAQNGK